MWSLGFSIVVMQGALLAADRQEGIEFFEKKIRPVLVRHCYECHSSKSKDLEGNLFLDSREGTQTGGESGPALVPGEPTASLLISAIKYDDLEMPPTGKLPEKVIRDFEKWVRMGAPDPRDVDKSVSAPLRSEIDFEAARQFWSFQPPRRHPQPKIRDRDWIKQPIDGFILERLEQAGLKPSPPADRRTWIRRVTFDLIGLPPTPEEVEEFLKNSSANAKEKIVERLLAPPHYGERWARLWLDVARYAEDQAHIVGDKKSLFYPNAYLYRDWVIGALNDDLPYDRFIKLQLAADLIEPEDRTNHAALGFIGLGPKYYRRSDPEVIADEREDRIDTVSRGLLGLTVACARCHDHKYDPITMEDYYGLAGVFANTEMFNRPLDENRPVDDNGQAKKPEDSLHIVRDGEPVDSHVLIRGDVSNPGPIVKRRFLRVLEEYPEPFDVGSGREELAEAIVDPTNPLTARVLVNRVWAQHFGKPLVGTPSNFGSLGERPTHPELLDDLAVRFMENGWSLKWLNRQIVLSATYGQSSRVSSPANRLDPENRLLSRMNRRRLDVEWWRDSILAVSGKLDYSVGGESIDPQDPNATRRTVYSRISRLDLNPMLALFDFPDPNAHSARRNQTTTPLQKLFVSNSPFMVRHANALMDRLLGRNFQNERSRIRYAYHLTFGRPPTSAEIELALEFLGKDEDTPTYHFRWSQYAQVLLASNELLFVD